MAEATDSEGRLWGKLKSGLGWICLTDIRGEIGQEDPLGEEIPPTQEDSHGQEDGFGKG